MQPREHSAPAVLPKFLRFADLKETGIVRNWPQLYAMIRHHNFPAGRLLSPAIRAWTTDEIAAWLEHCPTKPNTAVRPGRPRRNEAATAA